MIITFSLAVTAAAGARLHDYAATPGSRPHDVAPGPGGVPGSNPKVYAVYVDERDVVWLSDWGANALVSFDPTTERFESYPSPRRAPTCGRFWAGPARCGRPSRAPTASWWCARAEIAMPGWH